MENVPEYIAEALRKDTLFEQRLLTESIVFLVFQLQV